MKSDSAFLLGRWGGPHCLDQKASFLRETGFQPGSPAGEGRGAAQSSVARRSGAAAPTGRDLNRESQALAKGPATTCAPRYTSHGV